MLSADDVQAIGLTVKLAATVTLLLLLVSLPLAWWLAQTRSAWKTVVATVVAMPLVLPPTVLGFYLLVFLSPSGGLGHILEQLGFQSLPFTFWGLVIASMIYSLPFVVQPIQNAMESIGPRPLEVAATLGAGPIDRFFSIVIPMAKPGIVSACVLGFAHTVGEFGVVLMIGGNIAGETRVVSVQMYDHVEALNYANAHSLAAMMLAFAFVTLFALYLFQRKSNVAWVR